MHFINSEELQMKALNRAIARTVSQIARHAGEGCHVPMIMALENHLDALLTMERKMLEGVQEVEWPDGQYLTTERADAFNRWESAQPPKNSNDNAQPAPDVIDMNDPRNWQAGDVVVRKIVRGKFLHFTSGKQYTVTSNGPDVLTIMGNDGVEVTYPHDPLFEPASNFFTWLRHGEVQS